jgi:hypothetical protein
MPIVSIYETYFGTQPHLQLPQPSLPETDAQPALHDRIKGALERGETPFTTDRLVA